jgi:hypothetical protein
MVSSTLIQNSICTERQRIVRAKQGGKGSGRGGRWGGAGLTEQQLWRRRRTEHPAWRPASILRLEPVSSTTPAFCSALRADGKTQREALAQALGIWGPVASPHPSPCRWVVSASPRLRCRPPLPFSEARARWVENLHELPDGQRSGRRPNRSTIGWTVSFIRRIGRPAG